MENLKKQNFKIYSAMSAAGTQCCRGTIWW